MDTSEEQARLTKLIEALSDLLQTKAWTSLVELHFSQEKDRVERLLLNEAKEFPVKHDDIYKLQGELIWATRYSDISTWIKQLINQLSTLKKHE